MPSPLIVTEATDQATWDTFLHQQTYSPFLQSWTMGEVYRACGQEPIRLALHDEHNVTQGICQAFLVNARRGRHLSIPYGPIIDTTADMEVLFAHLNQRARDYHCSFIRFSPFWPNTTEHTTALQKVGAKPAPLHMLGEYLWHLPLTKANGWPGAHPERTPRTEEDLLMGMRKTTRNLIRRAQKEGVVIRRSTQPLDDIAQFLTLHEETRKRHQFVPYTNQFFTEQVRQFSARDECSLYLAEYQGEVLAASVHMHLGGETSYHHGASTHAHPKIPASYLLQWTAICDALKRGDHTYNFWGVAPGIMTEDKYVITAKHHPFAGVTTFKTGFGGTMIQLTPCQDIPLQSKYYCTRLFETLRKWKRGF